MRKTEETPEHYELLEQNSGCAIASAFVIVALSIILIVWSFVGCGKVKQGANCEAYHTGNTNHKSGK